MKRSFYYEYDEIGKTWDVIEVDGGKDQGQFYDALMFSCPTEQDSIYAIELLMELQNE